MMKTLADRTAFAAIGVLALGLIAVLGGIVRAGPLDPVAPPGSTMKTLQDVEPRTPISAPTTITQQGSYYLTARRLWNLQNRHSRGLA